MSRTIPLSKAATSSSTGRVIDSLHGAIVDGDIEDVKRKIESGYDVNQISTDGNYPLCIAAYLGHAEIVKLLLDSKADINATNRTTKWTACHCATIKGHGKVLLYLMQYQPNVTLKDSMGRTAVDFASVHDAIWPYFGVLKYQRTCKEELIRLQIIEKEISSLSHEGDSTQSKPLKRLNYFSRPGSSYVLSSTPHNLSSPK